MKRMLILTILLISGTVIAAEMNMPEAPTKSPYSNHSTNSSSATNSKNKAATNNYQKNTDSYRSNLILSSNPKAQLDSLAISVLKAAERHDEDTADLYIMKMMHIGITGLSEPQVITKQTPTCPPVEIELNGKKLKGSLCAKVGYEFKGQEHWVGYCK